MNNNNSMPHTQINIPLPDMSGINKMIQDLSTANAAAESAKSAAGMHERIVKLITEFEKHLNPNLEAGVRLVTFGKTVQFHIQNLGYWNPNIIIFYGTLEDGSPVQLVQHMSQLSFLLVAMKRRNPEAPRRCIGFSQENGDVVCPVDE